MAKTEEVEEAARALVAAVLEMLREHDLAVRLRPTEWMNLMASGGMTVMALPDFQRLEAALRAAFPDRFTGPVGTHDLPTQFIWALVDGVVLTAASSYNQLAVSSEEVTAAVDEMLDLVQRDRDHAVAARVISDIAVQEVFQVGRVELRPVGSWGLNDAYRDIDRFIPGAGRLLDSEVKFRGGPSFTYATLLSRADAPLTDRTVEAHSRARGLAYGRLETLTAALRLATGATCQSVVDIDAPPGRVRLWKPQVYRHDTDLMEITQRIGRPRADDADALAALGDRLASWEGETDRPHSLGVALSRFNRSFVTRPWFDTLVDIVVGLEAALLGGADHEEIGLRLRSRAAALLATSRDPATKVYEDVKRLYNLRSAVVHGSNPPPEKLEAQAFQISVAGRSHLKGEQWALVMDRGRDLLRRAILARGFLTDAGRWPTKGRQAERFDIDALLIDVNGRDEVRKIWRDRIADIGLPAAADEVSPASLMVELPDHSAGPLGQPIVNDPGPAESRLDPP